MDASKSIPLNVETDSHGESKTTLNDDHDCAPKREHLPGNQACVKHKWQGES